MRTMGRSHVLKIVVALLLVAAFMPGCRSMTGRSVGRVIDDKTITAQVKSNGQKNSSSSGKRLRASAKPVSVVVEMATSQSGWRRRKPVTSGRSR